MRNEVEEARTILRWAVDRASLRSVAEDVGIGHTVLSRFVSGKAQKPGADALAQIIPYVARRRADYAEAHQTTPRSTTETNGAPSTTAPQDVAAFRQIPVSELAYWRGVIETEHRHLHGLSQSMEALLGMLRSATDGIGGFIASGALPAPRGPVGRPVMTEAEVEAQVAAFRRQQQQDDDERGERSA